MPSNTTAAETKNGARAANIIPRPHSTEKAHGKSPRDNQRTLERETREWLRRQWKLRSSK